MNEIDHTLRQQGYAGKTDIPKIVFLAAHTRHFKNPVSLVVMGTSGSGKTYGIESGLQFIPPAAIESVSGMSEKALPYYKGNTLKHRVLYLGEAAGMADGHGRAFLRQLMTEGKLDYMTVQKTPSGLRGEKLDTVEGPICFIMATTATKIHHEDQSRMLLLQTDENPARTRQLLINQSLGKTRDKVPLDTGEWLKVDQAVAAFGGGVVVPYAERLAMRLPTTNIKIARDFPKVLGLIEACALVHMRDREKTPDGRVIASEADYSAVHEMINPHLSIGLELDVRKAIVELVREVEDYNRRTNYAVGVSQSKLSDLLKMDRSVVTRNVNAAIQQGYLINRTPGQGREANVVVGDRKIPSSAALPSPADLFGKADQEKAKPW